MSTLLTRIRQSVSRGRRSRPASIGEVEETATQPCMCVYRYTINSILMCLVVVDEISDFTLGLWKMLGVAQVKNGVSGERRRMPRRQRKPPGKFEVFGFI